MDRKPKSLIMAPGTKMATTAAAIRITRMVPRVTRRLVRDCFIRLLFRANRSVTRMEAIPKASPEPPPTTVINRVPSTTPPRSWGINRATNTGNTWEVESRGMRSPGTVWPRAWSAATSSAVMQWPRMYRPMRMQATPMGGISRALSRAPFRAALSLLPDQMAWA